MGYERGQLHGFRAVIAQRGRMAQQKVGGYNSGQEMDVRGCKYLSWTTVGLGGDTR